MNAVIAKFPALLEHEVPPEIIRLLFLDDLQNIIDLQKSQTPVPIVGSVEEACDHPDTKNINAVVNERSSEDEVDINARHNATLQNIVEQLKTKSNKDNLRTERVEVKPGNTMIDNLSRGTSV